MVDRRSFPSLRAFTTFQVAARHLSFTRAADEMNISQAAVSQQIRFLETSLDRTLFFRQRNALSLTADGAMLLEAVERGLGTIGAAIDTLRGTEPQSVSITISATSAMAQEFLWPIARRYRADHPEAWFVFLASDEDEAMHDFENVDLAFVCGIERFRAGDDLRFLFNEIVQPMCSPDYLERHGPLDTPGKIARTDLLDLHEKHWQSASIGWRPLDWETWLSRYGERRVAPTSFSTNSYTLLSNAVLSGAGVMLGWRHLAQVHLDAGTLVATSDMLIRERGNFVRINRTPNASSPHVLAFLGLVERMADRIRQI